MKSESRNDSNKKLVVCVLWDRRATNGQIKALIKQLDATSRMNSKEEIT